MNQALLEADFSQYSAWTRFWHQPIRAERLAAARIIFAFALLADQIFQYAPNLSYFFGPDGVAPRGINDGYLLRNWRWPILLFNPDDMLTIHMAFWSWMGATILLLAGWRTKIMSILVWLGAMCFLARNPNLKNGGDDVLQIALFLLMVSPCGRAISLDRLRTIRNQKSQTTPELAYISPWPVRLFQLQVCVMYFVTGVAKLRGHTWWEGTSIHNVLNDVTMARWSFAQLPLPFFVTAMMTWSSLAFEVFFPFLVFWKRTRLWTFLFGVCFHLGIYLTIEVGWFSFYAISLYSVWIPVWFWDRIGKKSNLEIK